MRRLKLYVEFDREVDGRWIADVPGLPGVMAYGQNREEAWRNVEALAFRVIADRIDQREMPHVLSARVVEH